MSHEQEDADVTDLNLPSEWDEFKDFSEESEKQAKKDGKEEPIRAYRENLLSKSTIQEATKRRKKESGSYRVPQFAYLMKHYEAHPEKFFRDKNSRLYLKATAKLPMGEGEDEAYTFYQDVQYSASQQVYYVILPKLPGMEFPDGETIDMFTHGPDGKLRLHAKHFVHAAEFSQKRAVGVIVATAFGTKK